MRRRAQHGRTGDRVSELQGSETGGFDFKKASRAIEDSRKAGEHRFHRGNSLREDSRSQDSLNASVRFSAKKEKTMTKPETTDQQPAADKTQPIVSGRRGRMVQILDLIAELQLIQERFGNTCVYIRDVSWGACALNRQAEDRKHDQLPDHETSRDHHEQAPDS